MSQTNHLGSARCILSPLVPLTAPHWCIACQLEQDNKQLRDELAIAQGRAQTAEDALKRARLALFDESEAHAIAERRAARLAQRIEQMEAA